MAELKLTPTQRRIYELLADGEPHPKAELLAAIDELATDSLLYVHVYHLRLKLKTVGEDIVFTSDGKGRRVVRRMRHLLHGATGT